MSWYSCKTFHECTQVCTYRLLSSSISARYQALLTKAECQQDYSSPCSPVLKSDCSSTRSLCACILQAPWKCDCEVQYNTQKLVWPWPYQPYLSCQPWTYRDMGYTSIQYFSLSMVAKSKTLILVPWKFYSHVYNNIQKHNIRQLPI